MNIKSVNISIKELETLIETNEEERGRYKVRFGIRYTILTLFVATVMIIDIISGHKLATALAAGGLIICAFLIKNYLKILDISKSQINNAKEHLKQMKHRTNIQN